MYAAFCRHVYLPALDRLRRLPYPAVRREAFANQRLPPKAFPELQRKKLQRLIDHVREHNPYYRDLFARVGLRSIEKVEDIRALPILEKKDVKEHVERLKSPVFPGKIFHASTSGSTGMSLRFVIDSEHAAWVQACVERGRSWWGLEPGERQLVLFGHPVGAPADTERRIRLRYRARNTIEFDTFRDLDAPRAREILAALRSWKPKLVYGYGSGVGRLAETLRAEGLSLGPGERPLLVEYTADHMFENERLTAEEVFGAPVITAYGARECGGMAQTCSKRKLHWSADHALCEIVRPDGSPADEGEAGDLVVTPFDNFAMSFIRYRIGDRLSFSNEPCGCGITLPVVQLHAGRASDMISTSARSGTSSVVFDFINRVDLVNAGIRGIRQFLVEQTGLDDFTLHVVKDDPFDPRSIEIFERKTRLALGDQINFGVNFVPEIPMAPTGKRRWFMRSYS